MMSLTVRSSKQAVPVWLSQRINSSRGSNMMSDGLSQKTNARTCFFFERRNASRMYPTKSSRSGGHDNVVACMCLVVVYVKRY